MCERRALHVFDGLQVPRQFLRRLRSDGLLLILGKFLNSGGVVSEINLRPDKQKRSLRTMVSDLRDPLKREKTYRSQCKNQPHEGGTGLRPGGLKAAMEENTCSSGWNGGVRLKSWFFPLQTVHNQAGSIS